MTSRTKNPPISEESKKMSESLPKTADLYMELSQFEREQKEITDRKKSSVALDIIANGEEYINEIDEKWQEKDEERMQMIEYLISNTGSKHGTSKKLYQLSHEEIKSIYDKELDNKKPWWKKLIEFFFGNIYDEE